MPPEMELIKYLEYRGIMKIFTKFIDSYFNYIIKLTYVSCVSPLDRRYLFACISGYQR